MARINLLPWREAERRQRQREFGVMAGVAAALGIVIAIVVHATMESAISDQQARNQFLEQEIASLEKKIEKVRELEATKKRLLARMEVIQNLQRNRPTSVRLMDQIVRTLPEGVYLTSFRQQQERLQFSGIAESNARVSAYMRNIESSEWMSNPRLNVIESQMREGRRVSRFDLDAVQAEPKAQAEEGNS